jgi:hypothetical protein
MSERRGAGIPRSSERGPSGPARSSESGQGMTADDQFVLVPARWWVSNLGGMVVTGIVARRSGRPALRLLFAVAAGLHVGEAAYAYLSARRAGLTRSAPKWGLQTLAVGFPSLGALRAVIRDTGGGESGTTS